MMKISRMQNKQREEGAAVMIYDFKNFKKKNLGQKVLTEERNTIIEIDVRRDPALPETMQKIYESLLNVALEEYCTISNVGYSKALKEMECRLFVIITEGNGYKYSLKAELYIAATSKRFNEYQYVIGNEESSLSEEFVTYIRKLGHSKAHSFDDEFDGLPVFIGGKQWYDVKVCTPQEWVKYAPVVAAIDKDGKVYGEDGNIVYYMGQFCRKTGELYGQCEPLDAWIVKWRHLK